MARTRTRSSRAPALAFDALTVEGALIAPAMLARIARHEAGGQTEADYGIPKGLTLRDEIARYFRIGQALFRELTASPTPSHAATIAFVEKLLTMVLGFSDLKRVGQRAVADRNFSVTLEALGGRVPVIVVPPSDDLDRASDHLATDGRRRSAASALQDWLNASDAVLWGLAANGHHLRLTRDNASLTRPAYLEADLTRVFEGEDFADFTALWLLLHASRFGSAGALPSDCSLERWREAGQKEGVNAREKLRGGVEAALLSLGNGFLAHAHNAALRERIETGALPLPAYFGQLLRLVYRLIFLLAAEDRNLLHPPSASAAARKLYAEGYSLGLLRDRAVRRAAWDRHHDRWEGLTIAFTALARGEPRLGLPALDGLFAPGTIPDLESARLANRALMQAIRQLAWLEDKGALAPVNWRDMETEELGSVYESLLELTPQLTDDGRGFKFAEGGEGKGHARKTTGSYYTPDSLVQALLDSALDPVLDRVEAEATDPAAALLSVTVLDPACGSGHFLLAAAHRIASRLARVRAGGNPGPNDHRQALRDVARACIYGVDRNPMAVELTKVALWIETVEPGKPLGFLDANIRCGDSLFGVFDLKALEQGIPDAAYKPLAGDGSAVARHYAQKNRREMAERERIAQGFGFDSQRDLMRDFAKLRQMPEDTPDELAAKAARLTSLTGKGAAGWTLARTCDLYVAAFLSPKTLLPQTAGPDGLPRRGAETVPTSGTVWELLRGIQPYGLLVQQAERALSDARPFHWPLEFPDVMAAGGFDVVLGNPPWERVEMQDKEFFALRAPEIANAKNAARRKEMIRALDISDPRLAEEYRVAKRQPESEVLFYKESGRFPLGSTGKINTYAVFADLFRQSVNKIGRAGLILPNGLVTGFTYRAFLKWMIESKTLASFYGFENEDKIFSDVHNETKFGILTMTGVGSPIDRPWFTAHIRQPHEISDPLRRYSLAAEQIQAINPNTMNIPAFRWETDAEVTAAIHRVAPVLLRRGEERHTTRDGWSFRFRQLFNMATDSGLFLDHDRIAPRISARRGSLAVLNDGVEVYPLYEGKMLWHFDHRYGTYENQTEKQANKGVLPHVDDAAHADPNYRIQPCYWVNARDLQTALNSDANREWFFAWRDVGPTERTLIGTIIPKTAVGHTTPLFVTDHDAASTAALVAILSSLVADYDARQKSSRMTFFVVEQLAVLTPATLAEFRPWLGQCARDWLATRVLELSYTNVELAPFARDLGYEGPPFRWVPERRVLLQAEIDAAVLHLYRLSRPQVGWLLDSFTVLRKYEEGDFGEYRTKRVVLEVYDKMAAAIQCGQPYRTPLSTAPADRSCSHAAPPIRS